MQVPLTQIWPLAQVVPQAPQLLSSDWGFTQASTGNCPPGHPGAGTTAPVVQGICPEGQPVVHVAESHTWPAGHSQPQVPQFLLSAWVSTQLPQHMVCPVGQGPPQTPKEHDICTDCPLHH